MFRGFDALNLYCIVVILFFYCNHSISAIYCYECSSTFPASSICLPTCSQSFKLGSTCLLTRNISLEPNDFGSLHAEHISNASVISTPAEKYFVFGEEAVYRNPSEAVGWYWEYGSITYGCDTSRCNNPEHVNGLPNALNIRIPNETLDHLLTGELDNNCYQCDTCLDSDVTNTNMSTCSMVACPNHACNFVATRNSSTSVAKCGGGWHFTSGCILSREYASVDMTLIYYIHSNTSFLYQMKAVCLNDNCNNFTTFRQLKDAVTVDPDLTCLLNNFTSISTTSRPTSSTASGTYSTTSSRSSTTPRTSTTLRTTPRTSTTARTTPRTGTTLRTTPRTGTTLRTTSEPSTTVRTTPRTSGGVTTVSTKPPLSTTTTASGSSAKQSFMNTKLFIFIIFFFLYH
ncbi:unnamed protein product [Rotaria sp. Silwood2]|nr:unnamed protein product [Rotaria sp. Silwood2]CAF3135611.1 unnamed protein product [Rotaria sp. Silwood2]CAF3208129.1 unnamed protein product [Rotaria sp. Silwood2]CAF4047352.1 unnamed protein product [Rotaria sp. Silwood2]CAF4082363.1 unnamed protein product [Rotaria sp. Silwood2]